MGLATLMSNREKWVVGFVFGAASLGALWMASTRWGDPFWPAVGVACSVISFFAVARTRR